MSTSTQVHHGTFHFRNKLTQTEEEKRIITSIIRRELESLGRMSWREGITLAHFIALALLWLSRNPGRIGGWGQLFPPGFVVTFY